MAARVGQTKKKVSGGQRKPRASKDGTLGANDIAPAPRKHACRAAPSSTAEPARRSISAPMVKPPYRVPSMAEIASVADSGYRALSLFAGCGGSCLGYRMAGVRVIWANEFIPAARETYAANHPGAVIDARDIRTIKPEDVLDAINLRAGELDLLDGSPPCASFSTAGNRAEDWGKVKKYSDTQQRTDDLFHEYARLLKGIQPKVFVAENVSGLVKGVAKGYYLEVLAALKACGYRVASRLLDAQWLGVPQARQRLIFIGVRNDLGMDPVFPKPLPYRYSVREALPWVVRGKYGANWRSADAPSPTVSASMARNPANNTQGLELVEAMRGGTRLIHDTRGNRPAKDFTDGPCPTITVGVDGCNSYHYQVVTPRDADELAAPRETSNAAPQIESESDITGYAVGREWDRLGAGQKGKYLNFIKPRIDRPCPTVTQTGGITGAASVVHPTERRKFSIAELKRICGFPDDFQLTGSYAQQWERLGRAVPPVMMSHIARAVRDGILCKLK
ncbi:Modification methylase HaeIII [Phycisphaerae bacterium RAS2]|nr:Modification methylase HaeIII [Phycisphaerae bacterium RAS2]